MYINVLIDANSRVY